ncbi:MAG: hypothetical protein IJ507_07815 [Clostridia bacterium]|nr:hypothetical protein [Clostridia bacterium]
MLALAAFRRSRELRERRLRLARWEPVLDHLALLLREGAMNLPEALCAAGCGNGEPDRLLQAAARTLRDQPLAPLDALPALHKLPADEADALRGLLLRLTQGSRDSRVQAAERAARSFAGLSAAAGERSASEERMWRQLGPVLGACLTIWLM